MTCQCTAPSYAPRNATVTTRCEHCGEAITSGSTVSRTVRLSERPERRLGVMGAAAAAIVLGGAFASAARWDRPWFDAEPRERFPSKAEQANRKRRRAQRAARKANRR